MSVWLGDWDDPPDQTGTAKPDATATAGHNIRVVVPKSEGDVQVAKTYADGGARLPYTTFESGGSDAVTSSSATPQQFNADGTVDYEVSAFASTDSGPFSPTSRASARASDPQLVDTPGLFGQVLRLGQGSRLLSDGSQLADSSASIHFELDATNILASPIATLDLSTTNGSASLGTVTFNSDPRLRFFFPGTTNSISDSQVASLLNSTSVRSALASTNGLPSDLQLFHFTMDLTGSSLSSGAGFGAMVLGQAEVTPTTPVIQLVTASAGTFGFTWNSVSGRTYQVQYSTNLIQTNWMNLDGVLTATNSTATASDGIGPGLQRFYRVMLLQ